MLHQATDIKLLRAKICAMILASPVAEHLQKNKKEDLKAIVADPESANTKFWTFLNVNFVTSDDHEITIEVIPSRNNSPPLPFAEDEDELCENNIIVNISHPSHSASTVEIMQKKIAFYNKIVQLAAEINEQFCQEPIYSVISTAAQRKEWAEKRRNNEIELWLTHRVTVLSPGMRVGSRRESCEMAPKSVDVVVQHIINLGRSEKEYTVDVTRCANPPDHFIESLRSYVVNIVVTRTK